MKTFELSSIIGSIVAVGIALGAVVIGSNANLRAELRTEMHSLRTGLRTEMHSLRTELRTDMHGLRTELRADIGALDHRLSAVEQRQARTEGLLEALRDAIVARRPQDPPARKEPT